MSPYRRRFFGRRLEEYLREIGDGGDVDPERSTATLDPSADAVAAWCGGRVLPERREDLDALAARIASVLGIDESGVLARLLHGVQLDILEHTIRERLEVSVETAADLLDELRLES